jgi:superfamily I DNA/RNA helicase
MTLDQEQQAAVLAPEQFVRVMAGAGTGKTTCIKSRVRYLTQSGGVDPKDVCVVTFSKRAAEEIKRRVGTAASSAFIGTIHALGYRILQFERMGQPICDERKRSQYILRAIKETGCRDPLAEVKARIARARSFGVDYPPSVKEVGKVYERILHDEERQWDFDDLILQPTSYLVTHQDAREKWLRRFGHVIVDEAQDTSLCQWDLIEQLVGATCCLYVVGDPGQSIYTWRGAARDGMLDALETRFQQPFATYTISRNYRSRGQIIDTANRVLVGKKEHVMVTQARTEEAVVYPMVVGGTYKLSYEASVEEALGLLVAAKIPPTDVVILGRTHAVLGAVESVCIRLQVPYVVMGGFSFYDRVEIRDVMAYLEYAADVTRLDALQRFFNRPSRYLGRVWLDSLMAQGGWATWEDRGPAAFRWPQRYMDDRCDELWSVCQQLRRFGPDAEVGDVLHYVLDGAVQYRAWMRKDGLSSQEATEDNDADENLKALVLGATKRPQTVADFVTFVDQCRRQPKRIESSAGGVTISTIHRAKGLEWPVVVLVGLEEGILPHIRGDGEGEERRLYYVAVSRARDALVLAMSGSSERDDDGYGAPSRYVRESIEAAGLDVAQLRRVQLPAPDDGDGVCDAVEAEWEPVHLALPAPEGDAGGSADGAGDGDSLHRADGASGAGIGPALGSPGPGESDHRLAAVRRPTDGGQSGVRGDVERTGK